ncbi:MAG TPA: hypothetical protein VFZ34_03585 [Blastocatellia bacterium]|nr:hypothetical protein [Blastocatellia bacterium]
MKYQPLATITIVTFSLVVGALTVVKPSLARCARLSKPAVLQEAEREVLQERPNPKDPVELIEINVQGKVVRVKEKFYEDSEWIKKTSLKLKNKYTKTIAFIQVNVDFPETATSGIMMQEQYLLGRHPVDGVPKNQTPLSLKPNELLEVPLATEFERIKRMIERRHSPIGSISKILIRLSDIGFEDGTVYAAGAFFKKNPDEHSPQKWIRIEP